MDVKEKRNLCGATLHKFQNENYKYQCVEFDSMGHYVKSVDKLKSAGNLLGKYDDYYEWAFGGYKKAETAKGAINGIGEKRTLVMFEERHRFVLNTENIKTQMLRAKSIKRKRIFAESGNELCIDRIMAGDPLHWQVNTPGRRNNIVRIGFNCIISAADEHSTFSKLASLACISSDLLTQAGYSVELVLIAGGCKSNQDFKQSVIYMPVKRAEEPLDIERICSIGYSGFMRYYCHCAITDFFENPAYSRGGWHVTDIDNHIKEYFNVNHMINVSDVGNEEMELKFLSKLI